MKEFDSIFCFVRFAFAAFYFPSLFSFSQMKDWESSFFLFEDFTLDQSSLGS